MILYGILTVFFNNILKGKDSMKKIYFLKHKTKPSVLFFILFSIACYQPVLARAETCTSNKACAEKEYCDIDAHTCKEFPEVSVAVCDPDKCDLDTICPTPEPQICSDPTACSEGEYFNIMTNSCKPLLTDCTYLLNETCIECLTNADCPSEKPRCNSDSNTCETCGDKKIWDSKTKKCVCDPAYGGYDSKTGIAGGDNCMNQAETNQKYCRNKGVWDGSNCECKGGQTENTNNNCHNNGGCCQSSCTSNSDCSSGEYCYVDHGYSCEQETCGAKCTNFGKGTCVETATAFTNETISGLSGMVKSKETMTRGSAERFCQALGKRLVSLSDLGCSGTIDTFISCSESQIARDLSKIFLRNNDIWTSDPQGDICNAYFVRLSMMSAYASDRTSSKYAICIKK